MSKPLLHYRASYDPSIFSNNHGQPYCEKKLFLSRFNVLPNQIIANDIDAEKFGDYFESKYKNDIKDKFYTIRSQRNNENEIKEKKDDRYYLFKEPLLIYTDLSNNLVKILFDLSLESQALAIQTSLNRFEKQNEEGCPEMHLITSGPRGLDVTAMNLTKMKTDLLSNYNDDFIEVHESIIKRLKKPKDKGVVILHGDPGTGKTSYIRHLISIIDKKVIFLPPNLAGNITGPDLLNLLIDNPNAILIIEDAENIVIDRDKKGSSPVSAILNISDGLLSDCLQTQVICSFNTSLENVDKALLRKGRLIAKYDFQPLTVEKANKLSNKLGFSNRFLEATPLTEIFNQHEKGYHVPKRKSIGF
tara:strand:- start:364706 stop:365785 length:1080 start_codon:yes stop_codon:yes gene_type:complete